jgi:hypothetical protein
MNGPSPYCLGADREMLYNNQQEACDVRETLRKSIERNKAQERSQRSIGNEAKSEFH